MHPKINVVTHCDKLDYDTLPDLMGIAYHYTYFIFVVYVDFEIFFFFFLISVKK